MGQAGPCLTRRAVAMLDVCDVVRGRERSGTRGLRTTRGSPPRPHTHEAARLLPSPPTCRPRRRRTSSTRGVSTSHQG